MFRACTLFALWASLISVCLAAPVSKPEVTLVERHLMERSEGGPLIGGANFPDPSVIKVGNTWYAFATRTIGSSIHIQIASSTNFASGWNIVKNSDGSQKDALPTLPAWVYASSSNTWAPDVNQLDDGSFIMYYSATVAQDTSKHCLGAATASSVTGPYTPVGSTSLICNLPAGGAIDASGYKDGNQRYLLWKIDGNSIGHGGACGNNVAPYVPTPIRITKVASDGYTLQGSISTILNNNGAADQGIIEAPSLIKSGSTYVLFFSSNCFTTGNYNVNYATATNILGPYTRAGSPLFSTGVDGLSAPGGADIDKDGQHMLFHANKNGGRSMYEAVISISGTKVTA